MKKITTLCLLMLASFSMVFAQQSSKSKAAKKLYEKGGQIKLYNADAINTGHLEFAPAFYQNGIVFATSQKATGKTAKNIGETFFDLSYAELDIKGLPLRPEEFAVRISSKKHEGPVAFSRDGQKIYFTQNSPATTGGNATGSLKIYEASKTVRDWNDVREMPFNSDAYATCHPTVSPDGQKLYFSSDMPGGLGGMDLWMVEKKGAGWSAPKNLGSQVNTPGNEVFPFAHSSGNLFFASNGYEGEGGLDLFMASFENDPKGQVASLGEPFNTEADDLGLILNPEGTKGFFSSSRTGGKGKDDIYMFEAPQGIWGRTMPDALPATMSIFDTASRTPVEGAEIRIFEQTADGFRSTANDLYKAELVEIKSGSPGMMFRLLRKDKSLLDPEDLLSDEMGKADFPFLGERTFILLVSKAGYRSAEVNHTTLGNTGKTTIAIPLEKVRCGELSGTVRDAATNEAIPEATVSIWSGCDDSETLVKTNADGSFSHCLPNGCEYMIKGIKDHYRGTFVKVSTSNSSDPISASLVMTATDTPKSAATEKMAAGTVIILENIYYDFNKSSIRSGAARELEALLALMQKNPTMQIELVAHTDARGSEKYNLKLSQKRADSARQYLTARGIAANRITAIGKGEANIRNHCKDGVKCNDADHQYNRRTEVTVVRLSE